MFKIDRTFERRDGVTIPAGTCEVKNIDIVTDGHIKGTVRDAKGTGIPNIPVEAFAIDSKNEPESMALRKATSDAAGHYDIGQLPAREYIVAVNGAKYEDKVNYPPTFYPVGSRRDLAQRISLGSAEQKDGIDLVLPLPRETAKLILEVLDESAQPIEGALASVENVEGIQRVYSVYNESGKDGRLELTLWKGETYVIESFLYSSQLLPGKVDSPRLDLKEWRGKTGVIHLSESENYAKVTLRLVR